MVIGERFCWGHLGKTGGDATLALFRLFPELIVHADTKSSNAKHTRFAMRDKDIHGKMLVLNIRRLPAWILSRAVHGAKRGFAPNHKPVLMLTADQMAQSNTADHVLSSFTGQGRYKIDRWLRTEYLTSDFLAFVSELTYVSDSKREEILNFGMVNEGSYNRNLNNWFKSYHIEAMYSNNPLWTSIEESVYGNICHIHS